MRGFSKRSGEVHRVSQCEKIYTPQGINEHVGRFAGANIVTIFYLLAVIHNIESLKAVPTKLPVPTKLIIDLLLEKVSAEFVEFLVQNSLLTLVKSAIPRTELLHEVGQGIL